MREVRIAEGEGNAVRLMRITERGLKADRPHRREIVDTQTNTSDC